MTQPLGTAVLKVLEEAQQLHLSLAGRVPSPNCDILPTQAKVREDWVRTSQLPVSWVSIPRPSCVGVEIVEEEEPGEEDE